MTGRKGGIKMERYTQKQLKALVAAGAAQDITNYSFEQGNTQRLQK